MPTVSLLERIAQAPIMCDGAMKTQLVEQGISRGLIPNKEMSFSTGYWNVEHPEVVEAVHRDYLDAGCELILTNTFKTSSFHVMIWDRARTLSEAARESVKLIEAATKIARGVCRDDGWVLGDIGHCISQMQGILRPDRKVLREEYRRQAQAMRDAGADAIIIEYMADPLELAAAVEVSKQVADWCVIATPVFANHGTSSDPDYRTHRSVHANEVEGVSLDEMTRVAIESGADVVGAHCGHSLDVSDYLAITQQILASPHRPTGTPVMIQPNGSKTGQSQVLAESVSRLLDLGVRALGGCCGTTPTHLRAMSEAMRAHGENRHRSADA